MASLLFSKGGSNFTIKNNTISHEPSAYYGTVSLVLLNYAHFLPENYFTSLRSPLMRLDIPDGQFVNFIENNVTSIASVQPMFKVHEYSASLLQID